MLTEESVTNRRQIPDKMVILKRLKAGDTNKYRYTNQKNPNHILSKTKMLSKLSQNALNTPIQ